jgi:hypothetical protein
MTDGSGMNRRAVAFLEGVVAVVVVLSLLQVFFAGYATVAGWPAERRQQLLVAGLLLDLFFTLEFLVRLFYALLDRRAGRYLGAERGWIDLIASVPLLMLASGPYALALLAGELSLAAVTALRAARVLRILRIVKLFRPVARAHPGLVRRHVAAVTTIGTAVPVFVLAALVFLSGTLPAPRGSLRARDSLLADYLAARAGDPEALLEALETLESTDPGLLLVRYDGRTLLSRFGQAFYAERFGPGDYACLGRGQLELCFDRRPYARRLARA